MYFLASLCDGHLICAIFFYLNTATTELYTLSLHDALPIFMKKTNLKILLVIPTTKPYGKWQERFPKLTPLQWEELKCEKCGTYTKKLLDLALREQLGQKI